MIARWLAGLLLGAALLAVLALPPRREGLLEFATGSWWSDDYGRWPYPGDDKPRDADGIRLKRLQRALLRTEAQLERFALQDSVRRLIGRSRWAVETRTLLVTEPEVSRTASDRAHFALQRVEQELGRLSVPSGIRILLLLRAADKVQPDWPSTYLLQPTALDGNTCAAVVTLSRTTRVPELTLLTRVLGPCVYQAAFGVPGAPLQRWLAVRAFGAGADWDWNSSPRPAAQLDLGWWRSPYLQIATGAEDGWVGSNWSVPEVGCRLGDLDACARHLAPSYPLLPPAEPAGVLQLSYLSYWGGREDWDGFAGDLLHALGPDRFGELWRSTEPLDTTFVRATGVTVPAWYQRWLIARRGRTLSGPVVRPVTALVWLLVSAGAVSGSVLWARRRTAG